MQYRNFDFKSLICFEQFKELFFLSSVDKYLNNVERIIIKIVQHKPIRTPTITLKSKF